MPDLSHPARVAALRVLKDRVTAEYDGARTDAEAHFKDMRNTWGVKSLDVLMPAGESAGSLTISGPRRKVTWHTEALVDLVERTAPAELVEEIDPAALEDADLLDVIRETRPDLLRRSVRKAFIKKLDEALSDDGHLTDHSTGEVVKVADVDHTPVTGAFTFTPGDRAEEAVLEAWHRGELAGVGESLVPQIERTPEPAPTDEPTGTLPPGGQS
ncbi:hypothetical protein [Nocardiopsis sp. YSL2]|uniref:hypothetical protein n=1 Tax=Nocardiopsis sp. YSL2 TaxID=2939492 RepID=UPI0026F46376|nr:hypothetical protein [Nocardiopsis sp. YSL2]